MELEFLEINIFIIYDAIRSLENVYKDQNKDVHRTLAEMESLRELWDGTQFICGRAIPANEKHIRIMNLFEAKRGAFVSDVLN